MSTKRNRWFKKKLRNISKSYRVVKSIYVTKKVSEERRAYVISVAKKVWENNKDRAIDTLNKALRDYAQGVQTEEYYNLLKQLNK